MNCVRRASVSLSKRKGARLRKSRTHLRSGTDRVSAHVVPSQPISDLEQVGRKDCLWLNAVDRIASRSPNRTLFEDGTFGRGSGSDVGLLEVIGDGENVRVNNLMVEHDRVERGIDSIVDVVCLCERNRQEAATREKGSKRDLHITVGFASSSVSASLIPSIILSSSLVPSLAARLAIMLVANSKARQT